MMIFYSPATDRQIKRNIKHKMQLPKGNQVPRCPAESFGLILGVYKMGFIVLCIVFVAVIVTGSRDIRRKPLMTSSPREDEVRI